MATERIDIQVREDGSRVVHRNIKNIGEAARGTESALTFMKRALGGIVGALGINQIRQYVDTYTNLQNRLKQVTTGTENLTAVTNNLFDIANRTRSSFEGTAQLYGRVALATKEMGIGQSELLQFTERVNQAIILSGASATEASAGLIQFSQGLASGTLRGDELRSVLEQLPAVADVIAKQLKVTRGELRKMGTDGKITTDIILEAFRNADNLAEAFAKTVPTIGQAFQVLENQFIRFLGELDKQTKASETLARAIIAISLNFQQFVGGITAVSAAMIVMAGPRVIGALIGGFKLLTATMLRNPFGAVAVALAAVVTWLIQTDDSMNKTLETMGKSVGIIDRFRAAWAGAVAYIKAAFSNLPAYMQYIAIEMGNSLIKGVEFVLNSIGNAVADFIGIKANQLDLSEYLFSHTEASADAGQMAAASFDEAYKKTLLELATPIGGLNPAGKNITTPPVDEKELKRAARILQELKQDFASLLDSIDPVAGATNRYTEAQVLLNRAKDAELINGDQELVYLGRLEEAYRDALDPMGAYLRSLTEQETLSKMLSADREVEQQVLSARNQLLQAGVKMTEEETVALRTRLVELQRTNEEMELYQRLLTGTAAEQLRLQGMEATGIAKLNDPADRAVATVDFAKAMGIDIEGTQVAVDAQLEQFQRMYDSIDVMRKENLVSEQDAEKLRLNLLWQSKERELGYMTIFFDNLAVLQESKNKELAAIGKAAAIAAATIEGIVLVQRTLASVPYPYSIPMATAAGIAAAANVAKIAGVGFAEGGYTGNGGTRQVAGVVHGQEFVLNAKATDQYRPMLEAMNRGQDPVPQMAGGGGSLEVRVVNEIPGASYDVNQIDEHTVEIIARRVVDQRTDDVTAANLRNPSSRTSRSLQQSTKTTRSL